MPPPKWLRGKESDCQARDIGFNPWVGKIPWKRKWRPTPVFFPGQTRVQRSLVGYSPWALSVRRDFVIEHALTP